MRGDGASLEPVPLLHGHMVRSVMGGILRWCWLGVMESGGYSFVKHQGGGGYMGHWCGIWRKGAGAPFMAERVATIVKLAGEFAQCGGR